MRTRDSRITLRQMRDHEYDNVDFDILWQILNQDLPPLVRELERIVPEEPG
jgi:uncharacterized protein with HEPN domain